MHIEHIITPKLLTNLFPKSNVHIKYAFFGAHIDRYRNLGKIVSKLKNQINNFV